jgi:hypothetical protein
MDNKIAVGIYVAAYPGDLKYAYGCIQSIIDSTQNKYPITLLFDGDLFEDDWFKHHNIDIISSRSLPSSYNQEDFTGWGYIKMLPFFYGPYEHFVVIDADTVMLGNCIDKWVDFSAAISVSQLKPSHSYTLEELNNCFFKPEKVKKLLGEEILKNKDELFLSGFYYSHKGWINYEEYKNILELDKVEKHLFPGDQGILNYHYLSSAKIKGIHTTFFHFLSSFFDKDKELTMQFEASLNGYKNVESIKHPLIVHWGGNTKPYSFNFRYRPRIMNHFRIKALSEKYSNRLFGAMKIFSEDFMDNIKLLYYNVKVRLLKL